LGTAVKLELSGEVWNVTTELREPVLLYVILKATQGVPVELFAWAVDVAFPVKVKLHEQSYSVPV
jgi:hypothetical protein